MKKITLLVVLMGVLFTTTYANNEKRNSSNDRRTFFKEQIKPKVDEQRVKLDPVISDSDKQEISKLREEIMSEIMLEHAFMAEVRTLISDGEKVPDSDWLEIRAQQIMIDNILEEAKIYADKYQSEIQELLAKVKSDVRLQNMAQQIHRENPLKSMDSVWFLLWDVNREI